MRLRDEPPSLSTMRRGHWLLCRIRGALHVETLQAWLAEVAGCCRADGVRAALVDLTDTGDVVGAADQLRLGLRMAGSWPPEVPIAVLVAPHLLRGALSIGMLAAFAYALRHMPLTGAYALFFIAPLLITALSVPLLGEHVGPRRWAAIGVGLVGVLVVLRPTGEGVLTWAGLAVLGSAVGYALSAITVRVLHRTDSAQSMVFWMTAMTAAGAGALAFAGWVALRPEDAWVIAAVGVTGFAGQVAITEAFRAGEASVIAPFEYSALAWGLGLDWLVWRALPDGWTFVGAGIIVASGLYLIHRERVRGGEPPVAVPD